MSTNAAFKTPHIVEQGGHHYLNGAAIVRTVFEMRQAQLPQGAMRERIVRFQKRVRARLDALRAAGSTPNLDEVLASLVDMEALDEAIKSGNPDRLTAVVFAESPAS